MISIVLLGAIKTEFYKNQDQKIKEQIYKKHGILEGQNLIVSKDSPNGGIDSAEIKELIEKYLY